MFPQDHRITFLKTREKCSGVGRHFPNRLLPVGPQIFQARFILNYEITNALHSTGAICTLYFDHFMKSIPTARAGQLVTLNTADHH